MDDHNHHHVMSDWARIMGGLGLLLLGVFVAVLVCWMVLSKQDSKLYEADGIVCASQPFAMHCWERK